MSVAEHRREASDHDAAARQHEAEAAQLEGGAEGYRCGDTVLMDQSSSGGERLHLQVPCWSPSAEGKRAHLREAARLRADADRHRAVARKLEATARDHCAALSPDDQEHSPFWHRSDILTVQRKTKGGKLVGAEVLFRRVPSLTKGWMNHALSCHQAHAAVRGWDPAYMAYCPVVVPNAKFEIADDPAGLRVTVWSDQADAAALIVSRAEALLGAEIDAEH